MLKRQRHEDHMDETWLIPYADILTLLLALFIVLFASSSVDKDQFARMGSAFNNIFYGEPSGDGIMEGTEHPINQSAGADDAIIITKEIEEQMARMEELNVLKEELEKYAVDNDLSSEMTVKIENNNIVVTIGNNVLFGSGSANVSSEFVQNLDVFSGILLSYPEAYVTISGHTDDVPIVSGNYETNWDLSSERALNVMKEMLKNEGLDPARFSAIGYGEYRPIAGNETVEGRALNRRIEVTITTIF